MNFFLEKFHIKHNDSRTLFKTGVETQPSKPPISLPDIFKLRLSLGAWTSLLLKQIFLRENVRAWKSALGQGES